MSETASRECLVETYLFPCCIGTTLSWVGEPAVGVQMLTDRLYLSAKTELASSSRQNR